MNATLTPRQKKQAACPHAHALEDRFSKLTGVLRSVPGDVCCADCGLPLPLVWNRGKPQPIEETK